MSPLSLPPIAGREAEILALVQQDRPNVELPTTLRLDQIRSGFACALHMHQPTIPAGANGELISHLQYMFEHPGEGDNHNAEPFAQCYRRLVDLIPQLKAEGCDPRIMLDYSGTLLWGFEQMGRHDILEALHRLACDPALVPHVEWLGTFWGHAVAPSTPIPDLKLQILAWQQHFAALFGEEALQRVQGFSLPEMHLPNHPDTLYALVTALRECGYRWLLVQEHSVENLDGSPLRQEQKYQPNQLVARSSSGDTATITALIKTQGSDTKLVGQMQPCYEALSLGPLPLGDSTIPPLVSQIADGENGGVMMNEFPPAFLQAHHRIAAQGAAGHAEHGSSNGTGGRATVALNGTEYLALLEAAGIHSDAFPDIQAVGQHRLWSQVAELIAPDASPPAVTAAQATAAQATAAATAAATPAGTPAASPEAIDAAITALRSADGSFSMEGASWTNNLSWVEGYANVLEPMNQLSARFHAVFDPLVAADASVTGSPRYQQALLHLLLLQTSCFRYWGQGTWTDYAREIHRRGVVALEG